MTKHMESCLSDKLINQ